MSKLLKKIVLPTQPTINRVATKVAPVQHTDPTSLQKQQAATVYQQPSQPKFVSFVNCTVDCKIYKKNEVMLVF